MAKLERLLRWITSTIAKSTITELERIVGQTKIMSFSLDSVSVKLKKLPESLEEFEQSIVDFSIANEAQAKSIQGITKDVNTSVIDFQKNISDFKESIRDYGDQLNEIVVLTDEQLKIWKDQQKVLLSEYNRKPILKVTKMPCKNTNESFAIPGFTLLNQGNIEAEIISILITYPIGVIMTEETNKCFKRNNQVEGFETFQFACNKIISIPDQPNSIEFNIKSKVSFTQVQITIAFKSKYDSYTVKEVINIEKCK